MFELGDMCPLSDFLRGIPEGGRDFVQRPIDESSSTSKDEKQILDNAQELHSLLGGHSPPRPQLQPSF